MKNTFRVIFALLFLISGNVFSQSADETLAMQYFQAGDFEKALVLYKKLYAQGINSAVYYTPYFTSLLRSKQYDDAEKLVKKLTKSFPENYTYAVDYGKIFQEKGDEQKAKDWYDNLIKNIGKDENNYRDLANEFYRIENFDYAVKTFLAGRKALNDDHAFAFELVSLYRYQKNKVLLMQEYLNIIEKTPQLINQAENTIAALFDSDADYDNLKLTLLRRLQKDPQNLAYTELLTWQYIQQKNYDAALRQDIALDKRLKEDGSRVYEFTDFLLFNKAYSTAVDALQYLIDKGSQNPYYIAAKIQLLNTKNQILTSGKFSNTELQQLENEYKALITEFGKTSSTVFALRQLANLEAFYLNNPAEAETLLEQVVKMPMLTPLIIGQAKLELGDIYILTGEVWEANLTYAQVEKQFGSDPLGLEAKFRNAKLSYFQGDFVWAKSQLDVLKSATSQLIANDALNLSLQIVENSTSTADSNALRSFANADLLIFKNKLPQALAAFDSINLNYPGNTLGDDILMAKAKVWQKQAEWLKMAEALQKIADNFPKDIWADDAIFMLAELYETKLNNIEKAKSLYQKIITDYTGSLYVAEARKRFRNLRGDKLSSS